MVTYSKVGSWEWGGGGDEGEKCKPSMPPMWLISTFIIWLVKSEQLVRIF